MSELREDPPGYAITHDGEKWVLVFQPTQQVVGRYASRDKAIDSALSSKTPTP